MKILGRSIRREKAKAQIIRGEGGRYWFTLEGMAGSLTPGFNTYDEAEEVLQKVVDIHNMEIEFVDKFEAKQSIGD